MTDDVLDSLFHGCALRAYLEIHAQTRQFPPDSEATRQRAFQLYEEALAEKNRHKHPQGSGRPPLREAGPGCEAPEGGGLTAGSAIARRSNCQAMPLTPAQQEELDYRLADADLAEAMEWYKRIRPG